ncbi:MAG: S49 family peptidase [Bacteroidota bacterium]
MNIQLASALLRGKWAIDPKFALDNIGFVSDILSGKVEVETPQANQPLDKMISIDAKTKALKYYSWGDAPEGSIALVNLKGTLMKDDQLCGPMGMERIGRMIQEADQNENISSIVLKIDSPGGTVDGTEVLGNIVKQTEKPVVVYVDGLMASAALWIGSAADKRIASTDTDEIGSVGVLLSFADLQPAYEQMGVKFHTIVSDLSPDKVKMWEELRAGKYENYKKEFLNPMAEKFQSVIKENLSGVKEEHLTGKVYLAKNIMGVFVDEIGSFEYAVQQAAEMAKVKKENNQVSEEDDDEGDDMPFGKTDDNKETSNKPSNTQTMKNHKNVNQVLGVEGLESQDGHVSMTEEMVEALDTALANLTTERDEARSERDNVISSVNAIDESVEKAETIEDKTAAITELVDELREKPPKGEELSPKGEIPNADDEGPTVKDGDDEATAMQKIGEEFGFSF